MLKVRSGEVDKLGLLFERYKKMLFTYFYRINKDREASEDLVQMVFMRILKYRHAYRGDGFFKTWMFHIARNVHADHFKKLKKQGFAVDRQDLAESVPAEQPDHVKEFDLKLLEKALDRLPRDKKEVIVLSKLKGVRYKEIGEILGCPENTVKVRVFRALKLLKKHFKELQDTTDHG